MSHYPNYPAFTGYQTVRDQGENGAGAFALNGLQSLNDAAGLPASLPTFKVYKSI